ncbi:MAG: regulatory protein RecX [Pseudomonadota bacterium]
MTGRQAPPAETARAALLRAALRRLARREHSRRELGRRLAREGDERAPVDAVLDELAQRGLQSDARFAEAVVASRVRRGQGELRIRHELAEAGVAAEVIDAALERAAVDWVALAAAVCRRKFGYGRASAWAEQARRARFLGQRGFDGAVIRAALAAVERGEAG